MPLLEFLRKSNSAGAIQKFLHKRFAEEGGEFIDVKSFARAAKTRGEVMVAAKMNSRFSDKYFGQWLVFACPLQVQG